MLKRSYYNIPIKQKGFTIIYNSFSDHFLGVSQEVANRLGSGIFDPENFRIAFPKTFAKLQDLGMLIDDGIDELDLIKKRYEAAKFRDKRLYLMLYPTQDCNLKCWYCYESHKQGTKMSEAVIESVLNYVNKVLSDDKYEAIHVGFFGGEPLMNFSSIAYPLAKGIKKICESKAKAFSTFFVTNASLMTESIIEKMKELNPYFQITIDGYREKHDNVRVWKNSGKGTTMAPLTAIAPGEDWAMATRSSISSSSIQWYSSTNFFFISVTMTYPPPKVNALKYNVDRNIFHNLCLYFWVSFSGISYLLFMLTRKSPPEFSGRPFVSLIYSAWFSTCSNVNTFKTCFALSVFGCMQSALTMATLCFCPHFCFITLLYFHRCQR